MDVPGQIGPIITLIGVAVMLLPLLRWRSTPLPKKYRPQVWTRSTSERRQVRDWLRGVEPFPAEERAPLRAAALARVEQRWFIWFCVGASIAEVGSTVGHTGPIRLTLVGCFLLFMATSVVMIEREVRLGAAFLRRTPPPAQPDASEPP